MAFEHPTTVSRASPLTLRDILAVVFRQGRIMLLCFLAILLGAILYGLVAPRYYEAETKLMLRHERTDPVISPEPTPSLQVRTDVTEEEVFSEIELLKSRDLLQAVVLDNRLYLGREKPEAGVTGAPDPSTDLRVAAAVGRLQKQLRVTPIKKTNLIDVVYESRDPAQAANVLNSLVKRYLEKHLAIRSSPGTFEFFRRERERYHQELTVAEQNLAGFQRQQSSADTRLEAQSVAQRIAELESSLKQTQISLAETERRQRQLTSELQQAPSRQTTQVRSTDNAQLLQQLKSTLLSLQLKRSELLAKYEPGYRLVRDVDREIAQTQAAIDDAQKNPLRDITTDSDPTFEWMRAEQAKAQTDILALTARESATRAALNASREQISQLGARGMEEQELLRHVKTAEDNYLLYQRKEEEARISDAMNRERIVNVAVAEAAIVPVRPARPRWFMTLLVGLIVACSASVLLGFGLDRFDPTFRTPSEVQAELRLPFVAAVGAKGH